MAEASEIDATKAELDQFLLMLDEFDPPMDRDLDRAMDQAETLRAQLDAPVRIAVSGMRNSGKSSLVNLLSGSDIIPVGGSGLDAPPVILRHSKEEMTTAGWWDREGKTFDGLDLAAALAEDPDVVSIEVDCDVLEDLWLVDIPALDDDAGGKQARFALAKLSDMLLWCCDASKASVKDSLDLWHNVPTHLRRNTVMALTHADQAEGDRAEIVQDRLGSDQVKQLRGAAPIATPAAWQALIGEGDDAGLLWAESGAGELVEVLMRAVQDFRSDQLEKVQRAMRKHVVPARERLIEMGAEVPELAIPVPEPEQPVPTAVVEEPPVEVADEPTKDALTTWLPRVQALMDGIASEDIADDAAFIEAAQVTVSDFLDELSAPDALPSDADWVVTEFEKADDLLVLLQFETSKGIAKDAARVLLQLSDSLASVAPA